MQRSCIIEISYIIIRFLKTLFLVDLDNKPVALFPANAVGQTIESHGGLTYGGILTSNKMTAELMLEIVELLIKELKKLGFTKIRYKQVPHIFCKQPADEDIFALMQHGLQMTSQTCLSLYHLTRSYHFPRCENGW